MITFASSLPALLSTCSQFEGPPLPNRPFITVWNAPTDMCKAKWNVTLDFSPFDFVVNPDQKWCGEHIVIFYNQQLGLYPYFDSDGKAVNGGLPQVNCIAKRFISFFLGHMPVPGGGGGGEEGTPIYRVYSYVPL